jgi:hypothetical protein
MRQEFYCMDGDYKLTKYFSELMKVVRIWVITNVVVS